jgi:hypothetical protein
LAPQPLPQVPQFMGSFVRLAQLFPQAICSPGQRQVPVAQNMSAPQVLPHAPQLAGSAVRSTQVKVVAVGGQGLSVSAQAAMLPPIPRRAWGTSGAGPSGPPVELASDEVPAAASSLVFNPSFFELQAQIRTAKQT